MFKNQRSIGKLKVYITVLSVLLISKFFNFQISVLHAATFEVVDKFSVLNVSTLGDNATDYTIIRGTLTLSDCDSDHPMSFGASNPPLLYKSATANNMLRLDNAFQVGGGTLTVLANGNVGIGTSAPGYSLDIRGSSTAGSISKTTLPTSVLNAGAFLHIGGGTFVDAVNYYLINFGYQGPTLNYAPAYIGFRQTVASNNTAGDLVFGVRSDPTSDNMPAERMRITSAGNVGIGTDNPGSYKLYVNGSQYVYNEFRVRDDLGNVSFECSGCRVKVAWMPPDGITAAYVNSIGQLATSSSSKRFKRDVKSCEEVLGNVLKLRPVSFKLNKDLDSSGKTNLGFIAEEMVDIFPEVVNLGKDRETL